MNPIELQNASLLQGATQRLLMHRGVLAVQSLSVPQVRVLPGKQCERPSPSGSWQMRPEGQSAGPVHGNRQTLPTHSSAAVHVIPAHIVGPIGTQAPSWRPSAPATS